MISAVDLWRALGAAGRNLNNLPTTRGGNDRIGSAAHIGASRTVCLRRRRPTFPESLSGGQKSHRFWVPTIVDNFALRELPSLTLTQ